MSAMTSETTSVSTGTSEGERLYITLKSGNVLHKAMITDNERKSVHYS